MRRAVYLNLSNSTPLETFKAKYMTVAELKIKIADLPDHMDVMIYQTNDESLYGMSEKAEVEDVTFGDEDIPREEWGIEKCLVITDEL